MKRHETMAWRVLAITGCLAAAGSGCSLFVTSPPSYRVIDCRATVRSESGAQVTVATGWDQGFPQRRYFACDRKCEEGALAPVRPGERVEAFELDWKRYVHRQVGSLADGTLDFPDSPFARLEGPWCIERDTARCEASKAVVFDRNASGDPDFVLQPLGDPGVEVECPEPPEPRCLEITCNGGSCDGIDFGAVPVGAVSAPVSVRFNHCGSPGSPPVGVRADGAVLADDLAADFVTGANDCLPDSAEEQALGLELLEPPGSSVGNSSCSFSVRFEPQSPFPHAGTLRMVVRDGELVDVPLTGIGLGGDLRVSDAATDQAVDQLCFDDPGTAPCAPPVTLLLQNEGSGRLTVDLVTVSGNSFSAESPLLGQLPWQLDAGSPGVAVEVEACPASDKSGELWIVSDEPGSPTTTIPLTLTDACP